MLTAAVFDRVPVDEITRRAKHARPGHAAATFFAGLVYCLSWSLVMLGKVLWLPLAFLYMAADEGARAALGVQRPAPDLAAMRSELVQLRAENLRLGGDG
jgi:hypothetical protein